MMVKLAVVHTYKKVVISVFQSNFEVCLISTEIDTEPLTDIIGKSVIKESIKTQLKSHPGEAKTFSS